MRYDRYVTIGMILSAAAAWLCVSADVNAQLFGGNRQAMLGRTLRRQPSASAAARGDVGTVRNQRFVRSNWDRDQFVGRSRTQGFVGSEQGRATGQVRSAVRGVRQDNSADQVNQPFQPASSSQPYDPQLVMGFDHGKQDPKITEQRIMESLDVLSGSFEVSVANRTATLRGVVASEREKQLAEILTSFEPAISVVQNELQFAADSAGGRPSSSPPDPNGADPTGS